MQFTNSYEVIKKIEMKKRNGIALRKFKQYMESLNNPQFQLKCIHVGGTNGKGSTSNNIACVLKEAGYKVGLFTSPYLETHHDRIRVDENCIPDEVIVQYANEQYDAWQAYDLSMFEIDMYIAVRYFVECNVDFAVFEVGMGGDRDATNIIDPMVSVITNIGLDHTEFLGETYLEVAEKKAGIIKDNRALITTEQREECLRYFEEVCKMRNAAFICCDRPQNVWVDKKLHFTYKQYENVEQPTLAMYQANNASLAIETLNYLRNHNFIVVSDEQLYAGLAKAMWKGRFEVVSETPLIIVDGAHNKEGMEALIASAKVLKDVSIVFTALKDKPHHEMLEKLCTISKDIIVCEFDFPRADTAKNIAEGFDVKVIPDYKEAIQTAIQKDGATLICGSLYFISLVREYIKTAL